MRHFSVGLSYMMASGLCATPDDDRLSGSIETKLLSPSPNQTGTRKGSWSLWSNPLQFSKPSDETMISEKFDQYHWWAALKIAMPAAGNDKQKGPISPWCCSVMCHTNNAPKVERIRLLSCVSPVILYIILYSLYSSDLYPPNCHSDKYPSNFLQGECLSNQQDEWNAFHGFSESWSTNF